MIHAKDETEGGYDPQAEEEKMYADYEEALNDTGIVECVTVEPTYEEDDYDHIPYTHPRFERVRTGWPGPNNPMPHKKAEEEQPYFTGSNCNSIIHGFNMNLTKVYLEVARKMARKPTSNAPGNDTENSLGVVVRIVGLLLNKPEGYVQPVFDTFHQIGIRSCDALDTAL